MRGRLELWVGFLALFAAVFALTPDQWSDQIGGWSDTVRPLSRGAAILLVGVLAGFAFGRRGHRVPAATFLAGTEYESRVRELVESGHFNVLKVFGYTGETFLTDLLRFEDRYRGNMELRMIHRNWFSEEVDEQTHNRANPDRRPWKKAESIRQTASEPWDHPLERQIRYYDHQPIIKGIILCKPRATGRVAIFCPFHWVELPAEGGSQFKGTSMTMLEINDENPARSQFIDYLESQFDYEYKVGFTPERLHEADG